MRALTDTLPSATATPIPKIGFGTWLLKEGDECHNAVTDALRSGLPAYRHRPRLLQRGLGRAGGAGLRYPT